MSAPATEQRLPARQWLTCDWAVSPCPIRHSAAAPAGPRSCCGSAPSADQRCLWLPSGARVAPVSPVGRPSTVAHSDCDTELSVVALTLMSNLHDGEEERTTDVHFFRNRSFNTVKMLEILGNCISIFKIHLVRLKRDKICLKIPLLKNLHWF